MDEDTVTFEDEEGREHQFEILQILEVEDERYAILSVPDSEEEAVALRLQADEEGEHLVPIEDDEEWNRVAEAWRQVE